MVPGSRSEGSGEGDEGRENSVECIHEQLPLGASPNSQGSLARVH